MPLTINDDLLMQSGMSEIDARIEIACRWFDARKMTMAQAVRMTELNRDEFESELLKRNIAIYRPTVDDYEQDVRNLKKMGLIRADSGL